MNPEPPMVVLCRDTLAAAVEGFCPVHESDSCLYSFVQWADVRADRDALSARLEAQQTLNLQLIQERDQARRELEQLRQTTIGGDG